MCLIRLCISFSIFLTFCIWHCSVKTFQKYILCSLNFIFLICCINISQQESIVLIYMRLNGIMFTVALCWHQCTFLPLFTYWCFNLEQTCMPTTHRSIQNFILFETKFFNFAEKQVQLDSLKRNLETLHDCRSQCSLRNKHR